MEKFDGKCIIADYQWSRPDLIVSTDACLRSCGGWNETMAEFFHAQFPAFIFDNFTLHINELECLAIVIGVKLWGNSLKDRNVLFQCDNKVTVQVINKGAARNEFTQCCLRELCWITADLNAAVKVVFRPGVDNRIADHCSRWGNRSSREKFWGRNQGQEHHGTTDSRHNV